MKVSVQTHVSYSYEVEVPDEMGKIGLDGFCDAADPVYQRIVRILAEEGLNYVGILDSIVDNDTNEVLFVGE